MHKNIKRMPKQNTIEEVKQQFVEVHGDIYSYDNFTEYKNNRQKVEIYCKKHANYFYQVVSSHKNGIGCPKCGSEKCHTVKTTKEDFIKKAVEKYGDRFDYSLLEYKGIRKKGLIVCKEHGEFEQVLSDHLKHVGCKQCRSKKAKETNVSNTEEFTSKALLKHDSYYSYDKVEYIKAHTDVIITCPKHGDFLQKPNNHLTGYGCYKCNNKSISRAEKELVDFLKEFEDISQSNKSILNGFELDILVPKHNIAIEYNGLYWHSDKFKEDLYHLNKTESCDKKDITLIHIFEDEWRDKKDIVKSRLLNLINKTDKKIYARNCKIKEVNSKEASNFLDKNHIQGKVGAKIKLGLYHNDILVALMTFGNLRKALGSKGTDKDFELIRFCNLLNTNVVGGASKLLKYFENNYEWETIKSYADRRWSKGKLYENLGFSFIGSTSPNYFYTKGYNRENRFKYRKSEIMFNEEDKTKTERQIMKERGYERIYDSGTLKFIKHKAK